MIDAKTKVFGLLANPIGHSLSPRFQNALAAYCGENAVYLPFEVKRPETLEAALKGAHALGIAGLNVTVPYKEAVIPYLSGLSEEARLIGAVNTLVRSEEGYVGHNTDIAGMERMLLRQGLSIRGAKVLVLGAGGAARSAAVLAALKGAAELVILNRNKERAEALAKSLRNVAPELPVLTEGLDAWESLSGNDYLAIQCTSVGMWPKAEEAVIADPRFYEKLSAATDIVYTPAETEFLRLARSAGKPTVGGLPMLISQGIYAFSLWTGKTCTAADEESLLELVREALPA
ncbi:shikimate dehydrogenase [Stomatobaculum longum]|uniref:shikimate dehydrogenase n=1 Tax=Stomatobaculum longum TaxID=796942 RepID=UPI0028DB1208|nr:shikimate dehydrogenase [Stomatobaculum longum]